MPSYRHRFPQNFLPTFGESQTFLWPLTFSRQFVGLSVVISNLSARKEQRKTERAESRGEAFLWGHLKYLQVAGWGYIRIAYLDAR